MNITKNKLIKEAFIWIILIVITFVGTDIYKKNTPEYKFNDEYTKLYEYVVKAQRLTTSDINSVQEVLDSGREKIKKIKSLKYIDSNMNSQINSLSTELDKFQETIITVAKTKIKELQGLKDQKSEKAKELKAQINKIIESLEDGASKRAQEAAKNLKVIMEKI